MRLFKRRSVKKAQRTLVEFIEYVSTLQACREFPELTTSKNRQAIELKLIQSYSKALHLQRANTSYNAPKTKEVKNTLHYYTI